MDLMLEGVLEDGQQSTSLPDRVISIVDVPSKMSKNDWELLYFNEYKRVIENYLPDQKFELVGKPEPDPPDFIIERNGEHIGLDFVALFSTERKQASSEFWHLKERFRAAYAEGKLRKCKDLCFSISFPTQKVPRIGNIAGAVDELIDIFGELQIGKELIDFLNKPTRDASKPFPYPLEEEGITKCGTIKWRVESNIVNLPGDRYSSLYNHCGFELKHAFGEWITSVELEEWLNRLIASHDKKAEQKIDELVVVAGGPDRYGDSLTSELTLFSLIGRWKSKIIAPKHIKRVVLLGWRTRAVRVLYGGLGALNAGLVCESGKWSFSPLVADFIKK